MTNHLEPRRGVAANRWLRSARSWCAPPLGAGRASPPSGGGSATTSRRSASRWCSSGSAPSRPCSASSACATSAASARGRTTWGSTTRAIWLVSRGGPTFMTVRGLDVLGPPLQPGRLPFVPFYWLGAGPAFLYVVAGHAARPRRAAGVPDRPRPASGARSSGCLRRCLPDVHAGPVHQPGRTSTPRRWSITPFLFAWWFATRSAGAGASCSSCWR